MKKTLLLLFAALLTVSTFAQTGFLWNNEGLNGLYLDSIMEVHPNGQYAKTVYEYNSNKLPIAEYISIFEENGTQTSSERAEIQYNEDNCITTQVVTTQSPDKYFLSKVVWSDWDANKHPRSAIHYEKQEDEWNKVATLSIEYDDDGKVIRATSRVIYTDPEGIDHTAETINSYEYDSHDQICKSIIIFNSDGVPDENTEVVIWTNEYYNDGNLKKVTRTLENNIPQSTLYYYWGDGNATLIRGINAAIRNTGIFFDLSGHAYSGTPTEKGIYILNGKKVVIE
ncbi:MAG: hypothetical protein J6P66_07660 [Bacteroidaceae bacterium]|nr:hypothetical protein [Bacteroidaceae bacterium]